MDSKSLLKPSHRLTVSNCLTGCPKKNPLTLSSVTPRAELGRVSVTAAQSPTISPPPGADRGRQNEIPAMIRLPAFCHSERCEESKVHHHKTGQPVPRLCYDQYGKQRKNSPGRLYLRTDTLDSSTPLRFAQNDSEGVAFSSLESGSIVKCIPLSARRGRDTERGLPLLLESLSKGRFLAGVSKSSPRTASTTTCTLPRPTRVCSSQASLDRVYLA